MKKRQLNALFIFDLLILVTVTVMLCACDKHEEVVDRSLRIGNVYCADGSVISPDDYNTLLQNGDVQPVALGVIVAVGIDEDNYSALIMSKEDLSGTYAFLNTYSEEGNNSTSLTTFDGKENTSMLLNAYNESTEEDDNGNVSYGIVPDAAIAATCYTAGYIAGWHLPSVGELKAAINNINKISASLAIIGGDIFENDWYQTSTVDGSSSESSMMYNYNVIMPEGRIVSTLKTEAHKVRPFLILR